jgi:hypothetical protein
VALVADAIKDCSKRGEIALDPFAGSGTTLIAAEKTGRCARAIEFDPAYCDGIIQRFEQLTGKRAVLASTGQSFETATRLASSSVDRRAASNRSSANFARSSADVLPFSARRAVASAAAARSRASLTVSPASRRRVPTRSMSPQSSMSLGRQIGYVAAVLPATWLANR